MELRKLNNGRFVLRPWDKSVTSVTITAQPSGAVLLGPAAPPEQVFELSIPEGQAPKLSIAPAA